ncbi:MAG TPA: acyltransferase family protein [Gammaproteobacteria bacterium]|nr:acyltransferase family protein [Gammaproteobacteria bacterium]
MSRRYAVATDIISSNPGDHPPALHPKYRPDIDGLRALAVLAVLAFHAYPKSVGGGFIGVDVFFVISGFLISSILFANIEQERFSYADFYSRRIRRIFPALAVVLAASLTAGGFLLLPDEYAELGRYAAAGAGFVSNLLSWHQAGYFDSAADTKPLLHLWSLGVEEQFYIFWPLLIGLCWKRRIGFLGVTLLVAALSFGVNVYSVYRHSDAAFYSPLSRFWELMVGGALAWLALHRPERLPAGWGRLAGNLAALAGLALILAGLHFIRGDSLFPGWWALVPCLGTVLLIAAPPDAWINRHLLSNRVMVGVGLISYPLYLWHLPLLAMARILYLSAPPSRVRVVLLAASFLLAAATYFWVEKPLRFRMPARRSVTALVTATSLVLVAGAACALSDGMPARYSPELRSFLTYHYPVNKMGRVGSCWLGKDDAGDAFSPACVDPPAARKPLVLLWGDSHAALLYPGLRAVDGGRDRFADFARSACAPIFGARTKYYWCAPSNDYVASRVPALKPDAAILFGRWSDYLSGDAADPNLVRLKATLATLRGWGIKRIVVVGPAPNWIGRLPEDLARQEIYHHVSGVPRRSNWMLMPEPAAVDRMLARELSGMPGVSYFSAYGAFCDDSGCLTTLDGTPGELVSYDYGHLTSAGATYLAQKLAQAYPGLL